MITYSLISFMAIILAISLVVLITKMKDKPEDFGCFAALFIALPVFNIFIYPFILVVWLVNR